MPVRSCSCCDLNSGDERTDPRADRRRGIPGLNGGLRSWPCHHRRGLAPVTVYVHLFIDLPVSYLPDLFTILTNVFVHGYIGSALDFRFPFGAENRGLVCSGFHLEPAPARRGIVDGLQLRAACLLRTPGSRGHTMRSFLSFATTGFLLSLLPAPAAPQVNGAGHKPYLGWSTFSEQTINGSFLTQANIQTQSDALKASGLGEHGFRYINIDSGWQGSFDANGRPIPNSTIFPDMKGLVDHIHANGQKAGIYWIPGIEQPAVDGNYPILGTSYHTQDIVVMPLAKGNAFAGPLPNPYHDKI